MKYHVPGDSSCDIFSPIVGGHQEPFSSGHLTIPKRSPAELPGAHVISEYFIWGLPSPYNSGQIMHSFL